MLPKINNSNTIIKTKKNNKYNQDSKKSKISGFVMRFDGCSKSNPGLAGSGAVIYHDGEEIWADSFFVGVNATNNHAEYAGLILGLQQAVQMNIKNLNVEGDSLLVINQMSGTYKCNALNLIDLYDRANELKTNFMTITFTHIYRNENKRADQLSNIAVEKYLEATEID